MAKKKKTANDHEKVSKEFRSRLSKLAPEEKILALVLLDTTNSDLEKGKRQTRAERRQRIEEIQTAAEEAVPEIDKVLSRYDGKRLAAKANAMGCIPIQASQAAVMAVAGLDRVKSIIENQVISLPK